MRYPAFWSLLLAVAFSLGCGNSNEAIISGTVLIDGNPPASGSIAFIPVDGKSKTAGGVITDGKYSTTVPLGTAKVEIRSSKVVGQQNLYNTPDSPVQNVLAEVLPAKYNDETELEVTVEKGKTTFDFDLETKTKRK